LARGSDIPHTHGTQWELLHDGQEIQKLYQNLCERSDEFFRRLGFEREEGSKYRILSSAAKAPHRRSQVAVVCHGGFGLTWLAHLLQLPPVVTYSSFWLAPSSVTTILFEERTKEFAVPRCIGLSDLSHCYKAGLSIPLSRYEKPNVCYDGNRPSGLKANIY